MPKKKPVRKKIITKTRYRQGHFMGIGIAIGMLIGFAFAFTVGIVFDEMQTFIIFGPGAGIAIGISIGTALEAKYNPNPRPPTPEEKKMLKRLVILLSLTALLGLVFFLFQLSV